MQRRGILAAAAISLSLVLAGCFQGEQSLSEVDAPYDKDLNSGTDKAKGQTDAPKAGAKAPEAEKKEPKAEETTETVARQLYLIDANGLVAPQTLELPKTASKEVASQAMEYLVKGGPVTSVLPNGFQAVLPEGTQILGLNLKEDGTMIVDVSPEFKNYKAEEEVKILEAVTHTLTQFENVERIKLWINGHPLDEMPVDGTPIEKGYSRANGINLASSDRAGQADAKAVTMFFPKEHNNNRYYVPITKHVADGDNLYSSIINELIAGPAYESNAMHVFNADTLLKNEPKLDNGILELEFSEAILKDQGDAVIADEVMETLVRTLTQQESVEAVRVKVENVETLVNEKGEAYNDPVSKYKYVPTEKL